MKRITGLYRLGAALVVALGLLLGGHPASAGSANWTDPEGDAVGFYNQQPPRPSEPAYDVLDVSLSSDGKILAATAKFKQLGAIPPQATGNAYVFAFVVGEGEYTASVVHDHVAGSFSDFAVYDPTTRTNSRTPCVKCTGTINADKSTVEFKLPISSLESARRTAEVAGKIEPGSTIEQVLVQGGEYYNAGYVVPGVTDAVGIGLVSYSNAADEAAMPEPGTFTL